MRWFVMSFLSVVCHVDGYSPDYWRREFEIVIQGMRCGITAINRMRFARGTTHHICLSVVVGGVAAAFRFLLEDIVLSSAAHA